MYDLKNAKWRLYNDSISKSLMASFFVCQAGVFNYIQRPDLFHSLLVSRDSLVMGRFSTIFTSLICHASLPHFLFNAAFLNTISGSLNDKISPLQLWSSALSFGVAGSLTHVITRSAPACGFSGSLCGLTAFATSVDPVHRYVMIFPVPSLNITNGQLFDMTIVLNIIGHAATKRGYFRNTSFTGHLGGVLAGWLVSELNSLYDPRFKSIMRMRWQRSTLEWKATFGDRWDVFRGLMSSSQSSKRFDYIDLKFW